MKMTKTFGRIAVRTLQCLLAVWCAAVLVFFAWIAREARLSAYEPRGFTSEYDKDVSQLFPEYSAETKGRVVACYRETLEIVASLEEATDFFRAEIYFDAGRIKGWTFFFALKRIGAFYGELEIASSGYATEVYVHRHFAEKPRPIKQDMAERQLNDVQREEINAAASYAILTAGKTCYYDGHGELLREYKYGE